MTSIIPSLNSPLLDSGTALPNFNGSIITPDNILQNLNIGQQLNVQIMPQTLQNIGGKLLLNIDFNLPDAQGNNISVSVPVEISEQIKIPPQSSQMAIRIISNTPQKLEFRISSIDNQPISNFIGDKNIQSNQNVSAHVSDLKTNIQKHPLFPLKLQNAIETIMHKHGFSEQQVTNLGAQIQSFQLKTEIVSILPNLTNISPQAITEFPQDIASQLINLFKETPVAASHFSAPQNINHNEVDWLNPVKTQENSAVPPSNITTPSNLGSMPVSNEPLEQILQMFTGKEILAQAYTKGEVLVLQTPLGDILPEYPLKLEEGQNLLLKINELTSITSFDLTPKSSISLGNKIIELLIPLQKELLPEHFALLIDKIPANNIKMISNILSFLKATDSGNIRDWLGEEITETLHRLGPKGQETLRQIDTLIIGKAEENSQWRIIEIPFYGSDILSKISVAIRRYTDEENKQRQQSKKSSATRFVVDTNFTRLGAFQFDGFSLPQNKRFDLIIRTEKDLGKDICSQIMQIFRSSLSTVDYAGNISINIKEKFIKLCEDKPENITLQDGIYI